MPLKNAFKLVEGRRKLRAKPFLKAIPLPESSNLRKEAEPGEECTVILDGFYPLPEGKLVILFSMEESFAVMVMVKKSSYPALKDVSTKYMIRLDCATQRELFEKLKKRNPDINARDIVTVIEGEVV